MSARTAFVANVTGPVTGTPPTVGETRNVTVGVAGGVGVTADPGQTSGTGSTPSGVSVGAGVEPARCW